MTLDIDGKKTENPDDTAIAQGFESIDKRTGFRSGGLSLIILSRNEVDTLTTSGHPVEGWGALLHENNSVTRGADISTPLRQEKAIQIFQSYARGDDSWEKEFQWEIVVGKWNFKRMVVWLVVLLAFLLFARGCVK
jgi:hypothetical protein